MIMTPSTTSTYQLVDRYNDFVELLNEVENAIDAIPNIPTQLFPSSSSSSSSFRHHNNDHTDLDVNVSLSRSELIDHWLDVVAYSERLNQDINTLYDEFNTLKQHYKQWWIKYKLTENLLRQQNNYTTASTSTSLYHHTQTSKQQIDNDYNPNLPARSALRIYRKQLHRIHNHIRTYDNNIPYDSRMSVIKYREHEKQLNDTEIQTDVVDDVFSRLAHSTTPTHHSNGDKNVNDIDDKKSMNTYDDVPDFPDNNDDIDIDADGATATSTVMNQLKQRGSKSNIPAQSHEEQTEHEQQLSESLTDDVVDLAVQLKFNVQRINDALRVDKDVLSGVEGQMDVAMPALQKQNKRLKEMTSRACQRICGIYFLFTILILMFVGTYLVIKFIPAPRR